MKTGRSYSPPYKSPRPSLASRVQRLFLNSCEERHVYVRTSSGRSFDLNLSSPALLALLAMAALLVAWSALAFVHIVTNGSAQQQFRDAQLSYQKLNQKLLSSQKSFDENIRSAQEFFDDASSEIEKRHNILQNLIQRRENSETRLQQLQNPRNNNSGVAPPASFNISRTPRLQPSLAHLAPASSRPLRHIVTPNETPPHPHLLVLHSNPHPLLNNPSIQSQSIKLPVTKRLARVQQQQLSHLAQLDHHAQQQHELLQRFVQPLTAALRLEQFAQSLPAAANVGGPYLPPPNDRSHPFHIQAQRVSHNIHLSETFLAALANLPIISPVRSFAVASPYGVRFDPFHKKLSQHSGVDLVSTHDDVVRAPLPGFISRAETLPHYGNYIEIQHKNNVVTRYAHLADPIIVSTGQRVQMNEPIGAVGSTGRSTGPHLHYEISVNGKTLNPWNFIASGLLLSPQSSNSLQ